MHVFQGYVVTSSGWLMDEFVQRNVGDKVLYSIEKRGGKGDNNAAHIRLRKGMKYIAFWCTKHFKEASHPPHWRLKLSFLHFIYSGRDECYHYECYKSMECKIG